MSEQSGIDTRVFLSVMAIIAVIGSLCIYSAGTTERAAGRAEMKRWQDDWYASHPVVKEVLSKPPVCGTRYDMYIEWDQGRNIVRWKCDELPDAPKPKKGSKRRMSMEHEYDGPTGEIIINGPPGMCMDNEGAFVDCKSLCPDGTRKQFAGTCPAQPIPKKEPCWKQIYRDDGAVVDIPCDVGIEKQPRFRRKDPIDDKPVPGCEHAGDCPFVENLRPSEAKP